MHAMIDIESLGGGTDGLVVSIGAVRFDIGFNAAPSYDPLKVNITISSALANGAKVSGDTLKWWFQQDKEAQAALFYPAPVEESKALALLRDWIHKTDLAGVWAHGINYDLRLLEMAYARYGQRIPWAYKIERDTRTIFSLVPQDKLEWGEFLPKHDPVVDARNQVVAVQSAYKLLGLTSLGVPCYTDHKTEE